MTNAANLTINLHHVNADRVTPMYQGTGELANFILATYVSLHYSIYENLMKLASFKISYTSRSKNCEN